MCRVQARHSFAVGCVTVGMVLVGLSEVLSRVFGQQYSTVQYNSQVLYVTVLGHGLLYMQPMAALVHRQSAEGGAER